MQLKKSKNVNQMNTDDVCNIFHGSTNKIKIWLSHTGMKSTYLLYNTKKTVQSICNLHLISEQQYY